MGNAQIKALHTRKGHTQRGPANYAGKISNAIESPQTCPGAVAVDEVREGVIRHTPAWRSHEIWNNNDEIREPGQQRLSQDLRRALRWQVPQNQSGLHGNHGNRDAGTRNPPSMVSTVTVTNGLCQKSYGCLYTGGTNATNTITML
jgi:hypothetical protein